MIAINVLKDVHRQLRDMGRAKEIRCFFVEHKRKAYKQLQDAVMAHNDPANGFHVATFCGRFEEAIPDIMKFVGRSFALTFIDPTGWTGYGFHKISRIMQHKPGEVLLNYMFDFINRFTAWEDPKIISSFDAILGARWKDRLATNIPRDEAVEMLFGDEFRNAGAFNYVLSTRIEKLTDRTHFCIIYGTRSPAGLEAYRDVEYAALKDHGVRRLGAQIANREATTGQGSLLKALDFPDAGSIESHVAVSKEKAQVWLLDRLHALPNPIPFSSMWPAMIQTFVLRKTNARDICVELAKDGVIKSPWRDETPKKMKPHDHHIIELVKGK